MSPFTDTAKKGTGDQIPTLWADLECLLSKPPRAAVVAIQHGPRKLFGHCARAGHSACPVLRGIVRSVPPILRTYVRFAGSFGHFAPFKSRWGH